MRFTWCLCALLLLSFAPPLLAAPPTRALLVDSCPSDKQEPLATEEAQELRVIAKAANDYDRGLVLYEEGDYKGAVDAFVSSYCAKAHPAAFYNIAQSYERLLDFRRSVQYFERYVASVAHGAANRKRAALRAEVLRNLPAQLRIATMPSGAAITIHSARGVTARGVANAKDPIEVRQGEYTMNVDMPGFEPLEQAISTNAGQPYSYYLSLEPLRSTLQIKTSPSHARIFVDKRLVAKGSYAARLPIGTYQITVEAPGRTASTRRIELTSGTTNTQLVELEIPQKSGRRALLIASSLGLGTLGGIAMNNVLGDNSQIAAGTGLATAALGLGASYFAIPESVTRGDAWYVITSTLVGITEGALIGNFFSCSQDSKEEATCNEAATTSLAIGSGLIGAVASGLTFQRLALTTGDTALVGSGAVWGLGAGALFYSVFDSDRRLLEPMLLAGLNLGVVTTSGLLAKGYRVGLGRIGIINLAGLAGTIGGVSVGEGIGGSEEQVQHLALLGMVTGLVLGTFTTRYMDEVSDDIGLSLTPSLNTAKDVNGKAVLGLGVSSNF